MRGKDISILFGVGTLFVLCLSSLYNYLLFIGKLNEGGKRS